MDELLVRRKSALILNDLKEVERLARLSRAEFLADRAHQLVAERLLERIIGRMIDINYHIATERDGVPLRTFTNRLPDWPSSACCPPSWRTRWPRQRASETGWRTSTTR